MNLLFRVVLFVITATTQTELVYAEASSACTRIISLSPSITETLFALGLGENVVGVTRYCLFPQEAKTKSKIGGFLDPHYEGIVSLTPSIIFALEEQAEPVRILRNLKINVVTVDHRTLHGIHQSLPTIGQICGKSQEASNLDKEIKVQVRQITSELTAGNNPKVLIAIGGNEQDGELSNLFISGADGFYSELIALLGAKNLFTRATISLPMLSQEGIIALNPDIIVQIGSETDGVRIDPAKIKAAWGKLSMLNAVKKQRIYIFTQDFASIPSPRYPMLLKELSVAFYPQKSQ